MNHFTKALNEALAREQTKGRAKRPTAKRSKNEVTPEPGEWVYDMPKGMKPISKPEPVAGPIDIEEVQHHVRYEGLGHCIYDLISPERITNPLLASLWWKARHAMQDILECLESHK